MVQVQLLAYHQGGAGSIPDRSTCMCYFLWTK